MTYLAAGAAALDVTPVLVRQTEAAIVCGDCATLGVRVRRALLEQLLAARLALQLEERAPRVVVHFSARPSDVEYVVLA